jgi:hypothetical protein
MISKPIKAALNPNSQKYKSTTFGLYYPYVEIYCVIQSELFIKPFHSG